MATETGATWRTSSRSGATGGNCVEVADDLGVGLVGVRDSKDRSGPVLAFDARAWTAFLAGIRADRLGG
ncbi:DUF397 domain-containing protein [Micromonospora echinofusca]|uniref:DUF397 domain-containing protein n=1 Tax=Micromonospora echinofusca TaxID=47858 RepID=A0ABS3W056_MICEH|nr:DUF397 domain-containing protein [Micromonospora echinofusca]MBO4210144.1 DUF397 domain-containing protein [Micromonospora echinofusca]